MYTSFLGKMYFERKISLPVKEAVETILKFTFEYGLNESIGNSEVVYGQLNRAMGPQTQFVFQDGRHVGLDERYLFGGSVTWIDY